MFLKLTYRYLPMSKPTVVKCLFVWMTKENVIYQPADEGANPVRLGQPFGWMIEPYKE